MGPPGNCKVIVPFHPSHERLCGRGQDELVVCDRDKAQISVEADIVLDLLDKSLAGTNVRALVGKRIRSTKPVSRLVDEVTQGTELDAVLPSVLTQQTGLNKLAPGDTTRACRFRSDDRPMLVSTVKPPPQRRGRNS